MERRSWYDPLSWSDGVDVAGPRNLDAPIDHDLPTEGVLLERIHSVADDPQGTREHAICGIRGWHVDQGQRLVKIFLEYCPFKDLWQLIDTYRVARVRSWLPEPFIWYVLEELLRSAEILEHGTNLVGNEPDGWRSIIHQDIKPANVYLSSRSDRRFRHYPKIKLADFGMSVETCADDPNNPRDLADNIGTEGFMAPEMLTWFVRPGRRQTRDRELTEKTVGIVSSGRCVHELTALQNVWQVSDQAEHTVGLKPVPAAVFAIVSDAARLSLPSGRAPVWAPGEDHELIRRRCCFYHSLAWSTYSD